MFYETFIYQTDIVFSSGPGTYAADHDLLLRIEANISEIASKIINIEARQENTERILRGIPCPQEVNISSPNVSNGTRLPIKTMSQFQTLLLELNEETEYAQLVRNMI